MAKQDQAPAGEADVTDVDALITELDETKRRLEAVLAANELEVADDPDAKLVAALARAQGEYPRIEKTKTGEVRGTTKDGKAYSYTYAYADLGDVLAAVRPVLSRHGLALVQRTTTDERGKITLVTELRHAAGGILDSVVELGQSSGDPQKFGGALTYLRRYEAGTLLGVAPEEDTDARGVEPNSNAGGGRPAELELPAWATNLSKDRLAGELGPRLKVLLGDEGAREAAGIVRNNLGGIPAIVSMTAGLVVDALLAGDDVTLVDRIDTERARRRQAAEEAEAKAEEERLKAEADEAAANAERAGAGSDEGPRDSDEAPAAPPAETEPPAPEPIEVDGQLIDPRMLPAAGSVARPDVSDLDAEAARKAYRGRGCICPEPLEANTDESKRHDQCPIQGHGIGF